jgi:hypothetical protein
MDAIPLLGVESSALALFSDEFVWPGDDAVYAVHRLYQPFLLQRNRTTPGAL